MAGFQCAGTWIGPQAVIDNVFKVLGAAWKNYRFALGYLVDGGDAIVGIGRRRLDWLSAQPAAGGNLFTGHETCIVGREKRDDPRNVVLLARTAKRRL